MHGKAGPSMWWELKPGDLHSPQFWIDQKQLYFMSACCDRRGRTEAQTQETQFNKYPAARRRMDGAGSDLQVDGQVRTTEVYSEMRANPTLDARLFDPQYWTSVHWQNNVAQVGNLRYCSGQTQVSNLRYIR